MMGLSVREDAQLRETVRRTRLVYDSLRVYTAVEEEKRVAALVATKAAAVKEEEGTAVEGRTRRLHGDLRAAGLMRERGLWLHRQQRIVGAIPGIVVGDVFLFRMELCVFGLHG